MFWILGYYGDYPDQTGAVDLVLIQFSTQGLVLEYFTSVHGSMNISSLLACVFSYAGPTL